MINKRVKIVATIGPASDKEETILQLAEEGVNVFRSNCSHATREEILNRISWVRKAEKKLGRPLAFLGDLAGPKIRIGEMEEGTVIEKDQKIAILKEQITGNVEQFSLNQPSLVPQLKKGAEVFIDDGKLKLEVVEEGKEKVIARVLVGGLLKPRKGFNAQGISLKAQGLSEKDKDDMKFVIENGADAIAISFVQSAEDVHLVRELLPKNSPVMLVTKIETMKGMEDIEDIVEASDAIMVARGDLGLAIPMEEVPFMQKKIIELCRLKAKPVITATQMLESMTTNPIPTRAEVTDVANAILDGTDAVMLSGETAAGDFPVETVKMMVRIIRRAVSQVEPQMFRHTEESIAHAIGTSAGAIAKELQAKVIIVFTESGLSARRISRHRHPQAILALCEKVSTMRKLCFSAGVYTFLIERTRDIDHMVEQARKIAHNNNVLSLEKEEPMVIVGGMPLGTSGSTNMIYVERV